MIQHRQMQNYKKPFKLQNFHAQVDSKLTISCAEIMCTQPLTRAWKGSGVSRIFHRGGVRGTMFPLIFKEL